VHPALADAAAPAANGRPLELASEKHDVLIADETGEEILAATFAHDESGVRGLCRTLDTR
jgi:hypothetical protein